MWRYLLIALGIVGIDQATKYEAVRHLASGPVRVTGFLNLALVYNRGAAFGMLARQDGWQTGIFIAIAVIIATAILVYLFRAGRREPLMAVALMLVLGGAIGNLIDRLRMGRVVDFIDFHIGHWHWYTFNVADSAITIGALLLALDAFRPRGRHGDKT